MDDVESNEHLLHSPSIGPVPSPGASRSKSCSPDQGGRRRSSSPTPSSDQPKLSRPSDSNCSGPDKTRRSRPSAPRRSGRKISPSPLISPDTQSTPGLDNSRSRRSASVCSGQRLFATPVRFPDNPRKSRPSASGCSGPSLSSTPVRSQDYPRRIRSSSPGLFSDLSESYSTVISPDSSLSKSSSPLRPRPTGPSRYTPTSPQASRLPRSSEPSRCKPPSTDTSSTCDLCQSKEENVTLFGLKSFTIYKKLFLVKVDSHKKVVWEIGAFNPLFSVLIT